MPLPKRLSLTEQAAKRKEEALKKQEEALKKHEEQRMNMAAIVVQSIIRRVLASKRVEQKRRSLTQEEILAARRKVFLEERAASRRPGYSGSFTNRKQVEKERQRMLAARAAHGSQIPSSANRWQVARAKLRGLQAAAKEQCETVECSDDSPTTTLTALHEALRLYTLERATSAPSEVLTRATKTPSEVLTRASTTTATPEVLQRATTAAPELITSTLPSRFQGVSRMQISAAKRVRWKKGAGHPKASPTDVADHGAAKSLSTDLTSQRPILRRVSRASREMFGIAKRAISGTDANEGSANGQRPCDVARASVTDEEAAKAKSPRSMSRARRMSKEVFDAAKKLLSA